MDYIYEPISVADSSLQDMVELLQMAFPKSTKFSLDYLRWQYARNPEGPVVGFNAFYGDVLAAHYATMPIRLVVDGFVRKGLLSLNTATHPDHRGKRLFVTLADMTYTAAAENGYEFVIGVANANSTHGFLRNLGFYEIAPLDVKVGLGLGILGSVSEKRVYRKWDEMGLAWRLENPVQSYYWDGGSLLAPMYPFCKALIGAFDGERDRDGYFRPVTLYIGLGADYARGCYVDMPSFVHRSPFNLIFRDLKGGLPKIGKEDISFNLVDFDVI